MPPKGTKEEDTYFRFTDRVICNISGKAQEGSIRYLYTGLAGQVAWVLFDNDIGECAYDSQVAQAGNIYKIPCSDLEKLNIREQRDNTTGAEKDVQSTSPAFFSVEQSHNTTFAFSGFKREIERKSMSNSNLSLSPTIGPFNTAFYAETMTEEMTSAINLSLNETQTTVPTESIEKDLKSEIVPLDGQGQLQSTSNCRSHDLYSQFKPYNRNADQRTRFLLDRIEVYFCTVLQQIESICEKEIQILDATTFLNDISLEIDEHEKVLLYLEGSSIFIHKVHNDMAGIDPEITEELVTEVYSRSTNKEKIEKMAAKLKAKLDRLKLCKLHFKIIRDIIGDLEWLNEVKNEFEKVLRPPYTDEVQLFEVISNLEVINTTLIENRAKMFLFHASREALGASNAKISNVVEEQIEDIEKKFNNISEQVKTTKSILLVVRKGCNEIKETTDKIVQLMKDLMDSTNTESLEEVEKRKKILQNDYEQIVGCRTRTETNFATWTVEKLENMKILLVQIDSILKIKILAEKEKQFIAETEEFIKKHNKFLETQQHFFDSIDQSIGAIEKINIEVDAQIQKFDELMKNTLEKLPNFPSVIKNNGEQEMRLVKLYEQLRDKEIKCKVLRNNIYGLNEELDCIQEGLGVLASSICPAGGSDHTETQLKQLKTRLNCFRTKLTLFTVENKNVKNVDLPKIRMDESYQILNKISNQYLANKKDFDLTNNNACSVEIGIDCTSTDFNMSTLKPPSIQKETYADKVKESTDSSKEGSLEKVKNSFGALSSYFLRSGNKQKNNNSKASQVGATERQCVPVHDAPKKKRVETQYFDLEFEGIRLQKGALVVCNVKGNEECGKLEWFGVIDDCGNVGIVLENPVGDFSGNHRGTELFTCAYNGGLLVTIENLKKNEKFHISYSEKLEGDGKIPEKEEAFENDNLAPPIPLTELIKLKHDPRSHLGIQGKSNSCYIDTVLFSLFAFTDKFDYMLSNSCSEKENELSDRVRVILKNEVVNPLRRTMYCSPTAVAELRGVMKTLNPKLQLAYMDAEEFIFLLFDNVLQLDSFINFEESTDYMHQICLSKELQFTIPQFTTTQTLLEMSLCEWDIRFKEIPMPAFIIEMPRSDGQLKQCDRILPCRQLEIGHLMSIALHKCCVCGSRATHKCKSCYSTLKDAPGIQSTYFCIDCTTSMHKHKLRDQHIVEKLQLVHDPSTSQVKLNLLAILCIRSHHYTCYVRNEQTDGTEWVFFDSDPVGGNPKVEVLNNFEDYIAELEKNQNMSLKDWEYVPPMLKRLLTDIYICIYTHNVATEGEANLKEVVISKT